MTDNRIQNQQINKKNAGNLSGLLINPLSCSNISNIPTKNNSQELSFKEKKSLNGVNLSQMLYAAHELIAPRQGKAKEIAALLIRNHWYWGNFDLSHTQIAKKIKCSVKSVNRSMQYLHELGIIKKTRRGFKVNNYYEINCELVIQRPELMEGYKYHKSKKEPQQPAPIEASKEFMKGHFVSLLTLSKEDKEESIYNITSDSTFENLNQLKEEEPIKKPFDLQKDFQPSTKMKKLMASHKSNDAYWIEMFLKINQNSEISPRKQPWSQANANFLFERFYRIEYEKKRIQGARYIPADRRFTWGIRQKQFKINEKNFTDNRSLYFAQLTEKRKAEDMERKNKIAEEKTCLDSELDAKIAEQLKRLGIYE